MNIKSYAAQVHCSKYCSKLDQDCFITKQYWVGIYIVAYITITYAVGIFLDVLLVITSCYAPKLFPAGLAYHAQAEKLFGYYAE